MKQCSQCREWVQDDAVVCHYCSHRFSAEELKATADQQWRGRVIGIIAVVIVIAAIANWLESDEGMNSLVNASLAADGYEP